MLMSEMSAARRKRLALLAAITGSFVAGLDATPVMWRCPRSARTSPHQLRGLRRRPAPGRSTSTSASQWRSSG